MAVLIAVVVAVPAVSSARAAKRLPRHAAKAKQTKQIRQTWTSAALWSAQTTAKPGPARSIGATNAGCLQGADSLPAAGPGFELLHLGRHRYFGHPELVGYVRRLATAAANRHLPPLLVGDLSQARGGPTPTDHGSHQSGLDVDIAFTRPPDALVRLLDPAEAETLKFTPVVDLQSLTLTEAWQPGIADLLEIAVTDPAVDRIFVNPVIKRELCTGNTRGAPWLARLRPWWGHHDHFHVRLKCPDGDADCRAPVPLPPGDGCDKSLTWWFSREARSAVTKRSRAAPSTAPRRPVLPARCREVLN